MLKEKLFTGHDVITDKEADHFQMNKRRNVILGSDWVDKLEKEKENTSVTDIAQTENFHEVNLDALPL